MDSFLCGLSLMNCYKVLVFIINLMTAVCAYLSFKGVFFFCCATLAGVKIWLQLNPKLKREMLFIIILVAIVLGWPSIDATMEASTYPAKEYVANSNYTDSLYCYEKSDIQSVYERGEYGVLRAALPNLESGKIYHLSAFFTEPAMWKIADWVSVFSIISCICGFVICRRKQILA